MFGSKGHASNTQLTGMTALLAGSYGASTVWFLRAYLRTICLKYAEYGAVSSFLPRLDIRVAVIFLL